MGGFIYYGGLPLRSLGRASGLTDGLELAGIVKVLSFELSQKGGKTVLLFAQRGWKEQVEFMHY